MSHCLDLSCQRMFLNSSVHDTDNWFFISVADVYS